MGEVLGAEWGELAGLPMEEGLKIMSEYAAQLEDKVPDDDGGNDAKPVDARALAREFKRASLAPAAAEFIGNRDSAKAQASESIKNQGLEWGLYSTYVEQVMAKATPEQQTDPNAWHEAWWYVWGVAKRKDAMKPADVKDDDDSASPPRNEPAVIHHSVLAGDMNADGGSRSVPPMEDKKYKIDNEVESNTRDKFVQYLGVNISDMEWQMLKDVNTREEYEALQEQLKAKKGGK